MDEYLEDFNEMIAGDDKILWLSWLVFISVIIGAWKVLWFILTPILACFRHWCRCRQDLRRKYGRTGLREKEAYAVVTGGSDGIGLELCHQLA